MAKRDPKNRTGDIRPDPIDEDTRDPEFYIPDPEQVEEDREEAERIYNDHPKKKPAA
jgi:hypothetical protein